MQIEGIEANGYQLRLRQGNWYFDLWYLGKDTGFVYGPFTHNEAQEFVKANPDMKDIDKELTKEKVNRENERL